MFTKDVLTKMADLNEHPVILPLINPSSCSECINDEAKEWTSGRAIFASGSPFGEANCNITENHIESFREKCRNT